MFFQHQSLILRKSRKRKEEDQSVGIALNGVESGAGERFGSWGALFCFAGLLPGLASGKAGM